MAEDMVLAALTYVLGVIERYAKKTPNKVDDVIVDKLKELLQMYKEKNYGDNNTDRP